jgi:hypothetical protein
MKFPSLKYMATHGIYSVKQLYEEHKIVNETLYKECEVCAYVHDEICCANCHLKK